MEYPPILPKCQNLDCNQNEPISRAQKISLPPRQKDLMVTGETVRENLAVTEWKCVCPRVQSFIFDLIHCVHYEGLTTYMDHIMILFFPPKQTKKYVQKITAP